MLIVILFSFLYMIVVVCLGLIELLLLFVVFMFYVLSFRESDLYGFCFLFIMVVICGVLVVLNVVVWLVKFKFIFIILLKWGCICDDDIKWCILVFFGRRLCFLVV